MIWTVPACFGLPGRFFFTGEFYIENALIYGRTLVYVYIGDVCVNKKLLELGMAWHFKKYNKDPELTKLEIEEREKKIGLWAQPNPMPPWEWRKR